MPILGIKKKSDADAGIDNFAVPMPMPALKISQCRCRWRLRILKKKSDADADAGIDNFAMPMPMAISNVKKIQIPMQASTISQCRCRCRCRFRILKKSDADADSNPMAHIGQNIQASNPWTKHNKSIVSGCSAKTVADTENRISDSCSTQGIDDFRTNFL